MGLSIGYSPDTFHLSETSEALAEQNSRILKKMDLINRTYDSTAYGEEKVIRDFKFTSNSMSAVPVEVSLKYSWYGIMIRMGFVYYNMPVNSKSYVLTTGLLTKRKQTSSSGSTTFYQDLDQNFDTDLSNDEPAAIGLRPTYGIPTRFYQYVKAERFEIPVTFGISMFDLGPASFYFGGGFTFYYGSKTRVIHAEPEGGQNASYFVDDVDKFTSSFIGFHIMLGAEYRFMSNVGITTDLSLSFGSTRPVVDSVRTGAFTNNSLFHANSGGDYGGNENPDEINKEKTTGGSDAHQMGSGLERTDSFDFSGLRIMIGINYHIVLNPGSEL
ncbi:MAG: hypothetical protein D6767_10000 [Candidatus Hydrogenedentota bacterium]|nr:MAG: hypothetical protein D6767_10000 [Candidatus Hydrogenedentota bacterium]